MDAAHQSVKVLTRSRARGDSLTLPNGGHRAHLLHTGAPWTYLAFNRSKRKTLSSPRPRLYWYVTLTASFNHSGYYTYRKLKHWRTPHLASGVGLLRISFTTRSERNFHTLFMSATGFDGLLQNVSEQVDDLGIYIQELSGLNLVSTTSHTLWSAVWFA